MQKLSRSASGGRHLRWGREVVTTVGAHLKANYLLTADQKAALDAEREKVQSRVEALAAAVIPYRNFVEGAHIEVRAKQRVANYLCDEAQRTANGYLMPHRRDIESILQGGYSAILSNTIMSRILRAGNDKTVQFAEVAASHIRSLPTKIPGTAPLADALEQASTLLRSFVLEGSSIENQRIPLRSAVQKAIYELREELDQMDGRLRSHFSAEFIDSLYPELSKGNKAVVDDNDEDDDTSEAADD